MCTDGEYLFLISKVRTPGLTVKKVQVEQYEVDFKNATMDLVETYELFDREGKSIVENNS